MSQRRYAMFVAAALLAASYSGSASAQVLAPQSPGSLVTNNAFNDNLACFWQSSITGTAPCLTETDTVSNSSTSSSMALRTNETTAGVIYGLISGLQYTLTYFVKVVGAANAGELAVKIANGTLDVSAFAGATALNGAITPTGVTAGGGWTEYQTTFTASGATATTFFSATNCQGQSTTCFRIDEIRVPGPVPGAGLLSLALLGAAVGFSRFRRRTT